MSSVDGMPSFSKRRVQVALLSSAARMPLPLAASLAAISSIRSSMAFSPSECAISRAYSRGCQAGLAAAENLDAGQLLALQPFQERAAGRRQEREAGGRAGMVERGHRIAAAGDGEETVLRRAL